jgi:hypothetical protein
MVAIPYISLFLYVSLVAKAILHVRGERISENEKRNRRNFVSDDVES